MGRRDRRGIVMGHHGMFQNLKEITKRLKIQLDNATSGLKYAAFPINWELGFL